MAADVDRTRVASSATRVHSRAMDRSHFIDTRLVGDARITMILDGHGYWAPELQVPEAEWRAALPQANAAGEVGIDFCGAHIALGDASILIDLGFDDIPPERGHWATMRLRRTPGVEAVLAAIGVRAEEITHVLITHAHGDHIAGAIAERDGRPVARFPNARHLIGRADWERNPERNSPASLAAMHLGGLLSRGLLELVDGVRPVAPGVTFRHAPGESPGHSIVEVRSRGETFLHLGDLFHFPCEFEHLGWIPPGRDQATTILSRRDALERARDAGALLAFSHGVFPCWGRVSPEGEPAHWMYEVATR